MKQITAKEYLEGLGQLAETHVAYYRACLGAGCSLKEAELLTTCYMRALYAAGRDQKAEEKECDD